MDEPDTASPEPTDPVAETQRTRRIVLIAVSAAAAIALVALLVARPWESGSLEPAASPSGTNSSAPASPSPTADGTESPDPDDEEPTPEPVPISSPGVITEGLDARIEDVEAVEGEAQGPGEVSGPSIRFSVVISNGTGETVDLRSAVVTVDYGADRTPALQLYKPGASPMPTTVLAGDDATGVYVFSIPKDERDIVHITVDYSVDVPPLEFAGRVP
ncbi:hypothetical protein [Homoserinibacter sp. GY 40078]|uniref:hypothetical protein n=1 Tax=Homoserinibacter sp. GY 40078 TaxID=2603275 RepID=UPI0011CADE21|nr:hypothetical protein [Homoserinibacter sp. GY 40078]TXK17732.1 hypothetical protein FVQ89_13110 [Homoserinibacter sp. GY 40078]